VLVKKSQKTPVFPKAWQKICNFSTGGGKVACALPLFTEFSRFLAPHASYVCTISWRSVSMAGCGDGCDSTGLLDSAPHKGAMALRREKA